MEAEANLSHTVERGLIVVSDFNVRDQGYTRRQMRQGGGRGEGVADDHFDDLIGSTEFYINRPPSRKMDGYEPLKMLLESEGCEVVYLLEANCAAGPGYETIRITRKSGPIPNPALKRAHAWAHRRNFLHLFYKGGSTSVGRFDVREGM
ncbi:MAG: hypothetical protein J4G01_09175 [Dehalococcoidia bacterium]|nr:hypothetical protein [Dehalococcoidia bacterium]